MNISNRSCRKFVKIFLIAENKVERIFSTNLFLFDKELNNFHIDFIDSI